MRARSVALVLLLASVGCATSDASPTARTSAAKQPAARPPHLVLAESLIDSLRPGDTSYQHKPTVVVFPSDPERERAECRADCSGFVGAVLRRAYGLSETEFAALLGDKRPRARTFRDAIVAGRGFIPVAPADARPGDVLAISFPAGSEDTGHVMFLASAPKAHAESAPVVAGTTQWEFAVLDCTGTPHGPGDSRHSKRGKPRTGAGRGVVRVYVDAQGAIAGYTWSTSPKSEFRAQQSRDAAIGRFVAPAPKQ
jgi:hypothetical protein